MTLIAIESDAPTRRERTQGETLIDDYRTTLHVADVSVPNALLAGHSTSRSPGERTSSPVWSQRVATE